MGVNTTISISNSDDKLTQAEWSDFVSDLRRLLLHLWHGRLQLHGEWFALPDKPWQNANWCIEILPPTWWIVGAGAQAARESDPASLATAIVARDKEMGQAREVLKDEVKVLCYRYRQDSFAWTTAPVELIPTGWKPPITENRSLRLGGPSAQERARAFAAGTPEPWMRQAQQEGWLPGRLPADVERMYLNDEDRKRIHAVLDRNRRESTLGEEPASAPQQPDSTGGDEPTFVRHHETAARIAQLRERSNERKGNGDA
jgi:hypothetical protein